jgi:hypothetical protein
MIGRPQLGPFAAAVLLSSIAIAQSAGSTAPPNAPDANADRWSIAFAAYGYIVPNDQSYGSPTFSADHKWLHFEARYNYEDWETGPLWAGYNFGLGQKLVFEATPMLGAIFGNTNGIAPGYNLSLSYKRIELSSEGEFVFDLQDSTSNFFYSWNELTYSPTDWFHTGLAAQRTRVYHTPQESSVACSLVSPTRTSISPPTCSTPAGRTRRWFSRLASASKIAVISEGRLVGLRGSRE